MLALKFRTRENLKDREESSQTENLLVVPGCASRYMEYIILGKKSYDLFLLFGGVFYFLIICGEKPHLFVLLSFRLSVKSWLNVLRF